MSEFIDFEDMTSNNETRSHWEVMIGGVEAINHTAENLWERSVMYFKWCDQNPIYKPEIIRSGLLAGKKINIPIQRPYTISGLCLHIGVTIEYIYDAINSETKNDFSFVASRIAQIIHTQKLEMAISGVYNPVIVAKELKLGANPGSNKNSSVISIEVLSSENKLITDEHGFEFTKMKSENSEK